MLDVKDDSGKVVNVVSPLTALQFNDGTGWANVPIADLSPYRILWQSGNTTCYDTPVHRTSWGALKARYR